VPATPPDDGVQKQIAEVNLYVVAEQNVEGVESCGKDDQIGQHRDTQAMTLSLFPEKHQPDHD
jgi:hypothetical protein